MESGLAIVDNFLIFNFVILVWIGLKVVSIERFIIGTTDMEEVTRQDTNPILIDLTNSNRLD